MNNVAGALFTSCIYYISTYFQQISNKFLPFIRVASLEKSNSSRLTPEYSPHVRQKSRRKTKLYFVTFLILLNIIDVNFLKTIHRHNSSPQQLFSIVFLLPEIFF